MKTCFAYVRVSTAKQGEGVSLEAQRTAIERFAALNGITITRWFEELETAAKKGRPIFNQMLKELHRRRADGVVIHKIDRSARNFHDWGKIGELADAGIDVHFATESMDFNSRGGRLAADIQAVIAADYIRNLREEVRKGMTGRLQQGLYPLAAPIGYVNNGGGKPKTLDSVRAPLVKRAFELYASGQFSIRSLQIEMRRLGLRTSSGKALSKGGIEKMLANPFYVGIIRIQRSSETFPGIHEPLISAALFKKVRAVKTGRSIKGPTRHNHTYHGLFRCKGCGFSLAPEKHRGHVYYRCHRAECLKNCVREEVLQHAVAAILTQIALPKKAIDAATISVGKWVSGHPQTLAIQTATLQLRQLQSRLSRLTDALIDRLIDKETFNRRKEVLLLDQAEIESKLAKARQENISPQMVRRFLERITNLAEHYHFAPPEEKRQIVEIATSNRTVWNKNVYVEPSNWLFEAQEALGVFYGGQPRPTNRRGPLLRDEQIEKLMEVIHSDECKDAMCKITQFTCGNEPGSEPRE